MEKILINPTESCPLVHLDGYKGFLQIHGRSLPENAVLFYKPVVEWMEKYSETPQKKTDIEFRMVLINTSSSKMFIDIFRKINELVKLNNTEVNVLWYFENEDEDIEDMGLQYKEFCKAPFKMIGTDFSLI